MDTDLITGAAKPLLTALALPPLNLLLVVLAGAALVWRTTPGSRGRRWGTALTLGGWTLLWLLSTQTVAVQLSQWLLPQYPPLNFRTGNADTPDGKPAQAVWILGGGVQRSLAEYGGIAQLNAESSARLRYGMLLSRRLDLPAGFTGGPGWVQWLEPGQPVREAHVAAATLRAERQPVLRWMETGSRDTHENAVNSRALLRRDGVTRLVLVTSAWHMPRAVAEFTRAGFDVLPAPMGYIKPANGPLLDALPSGTGLAASRLVLKEWISLMLLRAGLLGAKD
ncbi:YdcF family protein [Amphibiibacter pelophylacis]|uniref:YdcF family protein n=1 Tax=Amphibiibacter pelophylacis TaxID=1799477 RepID=A0ACC6NZ05_9BURK